MKQELTFRQQQIFNFIKECIEGAGLPPTVREICRHFGFSSPRTVQVHLDTLQKKGWISRDKGKSRAMEIPGLRTGGVPIIGRIAAGMPVMSEQHFEGEIPVRLLRGGGDFYALKVEGDSMMGAQIFDGDYCIVNPHMKASRNDIVAALVGSDATVKRLIQHENGKWILHPENSEFPDIHFDPQYLRICGVVVGVWREIK